MSNDFEKWWTEQQNDRQPLSDYKRNALLGWNACKERMLKLLTPDSVTSVKHCIDKINSL